MPLFFVYIRAVFSYLKAMKAKTRNLLIVLAVVAVCVFALYRAFAGTYNTMVAMDEAVSSSWAQVQNQYQRRMDMIPNLVATVKGAAAHEEAVFTEVAEARSRAGGVVNVDANVLEDEAAFKRFQQTQDALGASLQRLLMVTESYPELQTNQNFLALQDQLEGTENRIATERKRFNDAAQAYNVYIRQFPRTLIAASSGFRPKPYFEASQQAQSAPVVQF